MSCYKLYFLIFLILLVVCFSYDNPGGSKKQIFRNGFTLCMHGMTEEFGKELIDTNDPIKCVKHAIINMKLYGDHRSIYPLHVAYYYQEFDASINSEKIMLPKSFCINENKQISEDCYAYLKIFEEDNIGEQNILSEFDSDDVKIINDKLNKPSGSTQTGPSVEPPAMQSPSDVQPSQQIDDDFQSLQNFNDEELQLIQNAFSDITQGQSSKSKRKYSSSQKKSSSSKKKSSSSQKESAISRRQRLKRIIIMNALYYHKVGEAPEGVDLTDESKNFFHKINSYGAHYMNEISTHIRLRKDPRKLYNPKKFCQKLYPGERMVSPYPI